MFLLSFYFYTIKAVLVQKEDSCIELACETGYRCILESNLFSKKKSYGDFKFDRPYNRYTSWNIIKARDNENYENIPEENTLHQSIYINLESLPKNMDYVFYIEIKVLNAKNEMELFRTSPFSYYETGDKWAIYNDGYGNEQPWWVLGVLFNVVGVLGFCFLIYLIIYKFMLRYFPFF